LDKYAVVQKKDFVKKASKEGTSRCPSCNSELDKQASVARCVRCGTEPFEDKSLKQ